MCLLHVSFANVSAIVIKLLVNTTSRFVSVFRKPFDLLKIYMD